MESPNEDYNMKISAEGDQASSGPSPTDPQELMSLKVPPELHNAVETLGKFYLDRDNDPNIKKFFEDLGKVYKEPNSESSKTSSSHAGTVKVHKMVTGRTFGADKALLKQLNCKELQVKMTDRQGCDIIILFCPINSCVGSDVEFAMSQVSGVERVILILMHHTRDVDYSTAAKSSTLHLRCLLLILATTPHLLWKTESMFWFVCSGNAAEIRGSVLQKMREIREAASELGIPQLLIVTKPDEACPETERDLQNIYNSL